ncbi:MAG: Glycosyl transferase, WecB/TagA/CpsF family [Candidatus Beckwithbacteria bacterium GW2011_GWB1_47_15]|uniref:Glycosyl transferase, WecB/TagA/CpsF family n=1 Tax=Candidatus Beckwithbacteria bacterium GW2011_GWB1_47_15 TaxID=1618371 RepID=A0A0G1RWL4_9BACT|nr:MAG: WecB/TagA/CpsF family glycosyl transferase, N-acetylglucosaminyldiphosphoundecaprenol [Candidatus Beckwithbacteria bacterium GW2011_GWC1_49_16]KKU35211.1 MAG: Glycosyl transferase, WecB/TagA/CpsF family [Candidatus Beckwithbacteria bacterium GW2011_GWA1_46_30]KKU61511.1 MAG: Glycosyl transferase, WecB/TagA/CpsF family [Candidatus Beckwithbacteria bacterium GW2011_GWB1_47_15]KKU71715.1 MAG: Glycosyl transferase, WecB/TagA/CpsF family [Candidatus Beckwithbacteria bacterium GW2011_GWA2_47_2
MFILGVRVDQTSTSSALKKVASWVKEREKRYIVTPNPEMIVAAQKDEEFRRILNRADLAIPDGVGLRLADRRLQRVAGADLMLALIKQGYKTLLVGGRPGVAQRAAERLGVLGMTEPSVAAINKIKPDLLFVALGHGKQEKWIAKNLPKLKVKVAMGVGGALDYIAKPWLRAPRLLQALGLEWLWRLALQPWRVRRQLSLVKFLWLVLKRG